MKAFISYSSKDQETAEEVLNTLEAEGIDCFYAPRDIRTGHFYADEIMANLETSDVMVLILSGNSNNSQHVVREVERAVSSNMPVIVYRIEEVRLTSAMEYFLMTNQWLNKSGEEGLQKLARVVAEAGEKQQTLVTHKSAKTAKKKQNTNNILALTCMISALACLCLVIAIVVINRPGKKTQETPETQTAVSSEAAELPDEQMAAAARKEIHIGDTVTFGTYFEQPVAWRVLAIEDGRCTLIAAKVLCMKGFEGAQSGRAFHNNAGEISTYDRQFTDLERMESLGSSDWEKSSLRAWLNSASENVTYIGQSPIGRVFCDGDNAYNTEPGFLNGFTEEEREAILPVTLVTPYHNPVTEAMEEKTTEDRVYLPSIEEVKLLEEADVNLFTAPTDEAKKADTGVLYKVYCDTYGGETSDWWLRTPLSDSYSEVYCVSSGYFEENFTSHVAAIGGVGVRPMMQVSEEYLAAH